LRGRVEDAIEIIGSNGWVKELEAEKKPSGRCNKLFELFPRIGECRILVIRNHFLFEIHKTFGIDLGICRFFWVDDGGHRQYCSYPYKPDEFKADIIKTDARCMIPQPRCIIRGDRKRKQKAKALCFQ